MKITDKKKKVNKKNKITIANSHTEKPGREKRQREKKN